MNNSTRHHLVSERSHTQRACPACPLPAAHRLKPQKIRSSGIGDMLQPSPLPLQQQTGSDPDRSSCARRSAVAGLARHIRISTILPGRSGAGPAHLAASRSRVLLGAECFYLRGSPGPPTSGVQSCRQNALGLGRTAGPFGRSAEAWAERRRMCAYPLKCVCMWGPNGLGLGAFRVQNPGKRFCQNSACGQKPSARRAEPCRAEGRTSACNTGAVQPDAAWRYQVGVATCTRLGCPM